MNGIDDNNNGQVVRLPAVRMIRHKESMITSNVDLNSDEETPDGDDRDRGGLPQISVDNLGESFDGKKKHSSAQIPLNQRNNIPLTRFSPKKADNN